MKLKLRQRVLTAAETSTVKLSHVFNDATRGQEGACRFGYHPMSRFVYTSENEVFTTSCKLMSCTISEQCNVGDVVTRADCVFLSTGLMHMWDSVVV